MIRKTLIIATAILPIFAFAAPPKEMVGQWTHIKYTNMRVEIEPNGSNYVVTYYMNNQPEKFVAVAKEGILSVSDGPMQMYADIEQKTGNLIFQGKSFRRLTPGESFESKSSTTRTTLP